MISRAHARSHFWRVKALDDRRHDFCKRIMRHARQRVFVDEPATVIAALEPRLARLNSITSRYRVAGYL